MKVLHINAVSGIRSTGRICSETAKLLEQNGDKCMIIYGREKAGKDAEDISKKIGNPFTNVLHYVVYMLSDDEGKGSFFCTKHMLKEIDLFSPDVIHLHNIHGHFVNYNVLFNYLIRKKIPVVYSFYDCWAFTGGCTHFDLIGCEKWKTECKYCPNQSKYPFDKYLFDFSNRIFRNKKNKLLSIDNLIISPGSFWMESLVRQSFLKNCRIATVRSGINLDIFKYTRSDVREKYRINKKLILLVASQWTKNKGIDFITPLCTMIGEKYQVVMIGDIRDRSFSLLNNVINIKQTNSLNEMVEWYSAADVYVNLTMQETLGLTNVEALACGTPVVTFDSGGCKECVDSTCGVVVPRGDIKGIFEGICKVLEDNLFTKKACRIKSLEFDKNECYKKYLTLYHELRKTSDVKS